MSKRRAPYLHPDGSNCWTKNCSIGHKNMKIEKENFIKELMSGFKPKPIKTYQPTMIDVIAPKEAFDEAVRNKRISGQRHPDYPYIIYKYSQQTTFTKDWDEITLASRGLVVNEETGEIVVRCFPKFFNYSEGMNSAEDLQGPFLVSEKLDGSLGLLYKAPDGSYEITTAGGFQSDQAAHATAVYKEKYAGRWEPNPELSYHYEVIFEKNRIVVNYHGEDDIYLLGAVNKRTGVSVPLNELSEWKWKKATVYDNFNSLQDVIDAPDKGIDHEGYVVHFTNSDKRVKLKFAEYLKVHRIATGLNKRRIHELMSSGDSSSLESFKASAPEEFLNYIETMQGEVQNEYNVKVSAITSFYDGLIKSLPKDVDQRTFAIKVQSEVPKEFASQMFSLRATGQVNAKNVWKTTEPPFEKGFWATGSGSDE